MNSVSLAALGSGKAFNTQRSITTSRLSVYSTTSSGHKMAAAAISASKQGGNQNLDHDDDRTHLIKVHDPVLLRTVTVDESFRRMEELVGSEEEERNWKGIIIALLVIGFILAMITTAIVLITPPKVKYDPGEPYKFTQLLDESLHPQEPVFSWVPGKNLYAAYEETEEVKQINLYDPSIKSVNQTKVLVPFGVIASSLKGIDGIQVSSDTNSVLIQRETKDDGVNVEAYYDIYSVSDSKKSSVDEDGEKLQYASFLGETAELIFVKANNIFHKGTQQLRPTQITADGSDSILNGIPDKEYRAYVMPEERSLIWTKGGASTSFVFAKVQRSTSMYTSLGTGRPTPVGVIAPSRISLHLYDGSTVKDFASSVFADGYLTSLSWFEDDTVLVSWMNKAQDNQYYLICNTDNARCEQVYKYNADEHDLNFVGLFGKWIVNKRRGEMYLILPDPAKPERLDRHIASIKLNSTERRNPVNKFLTTHRWSDSKILALDENILYFMSTGSNFTWQHLYSLNVSSNQSPVCLTCDLTFRPPTHPSNSTELIKVTYFEAELSDDLEYVKLSLLGPKLPSHHVASLSDLRRKTVIDSDHMLDIYKYNLMNSTLTPIYLPQIRYTTIPLDNQLEASVKLTLPSVWRGTQIYMYGLIIIMSDRPDVQTATSKYSFGFHEYLSKTHRYIIAEIDIRGSANRGEKMRQSLYGTIGVAESTDINKIIQYVNDTDETYKIDSSKIALFGQGYGGYAALHSLSKAGIKCGIIVSPVINLAVHDGFLSERYMGNNSFELNYNCNDDKPTCSVPKSSSFLLIHGTEDKVVDVGNSMRLIKELQFAGYEFRQQIYPGQGHEIETSSVRSHYYTTVTNYLFECFSGGHSHPTLE